MPFENDHNIHVDVKYESVVVKCKKKITLWSVKYFYA